MSVMLYVLLLLGLLIKLQTKQAHQMKQKMGPQVKVLHEKMPINTMPFQKRYKKEFIEQIKLKENLLSTQSQYQKRLMMTTIGLPSIKKLSPLKNLEFKSDIYTRTLPKSTLHPSYTNHHYSSMSLEWTSSAPSPYSMASISFQSAPSPFKPANSSNQFERNTAQQLQLSSSKSQHGWNRFTGKTQVL